jgi:hypothetical protein
VVGLYLFGKPPKAVTSGKMICKHHPHYKGIMQPKFSCWICWQIYKKKHFDMAATSKQAG